MDSHFRWVIHGNSSDCSRLIVEAVVLRERKREWKRGGT